MCPAFQQRCPMRIAAAPLLACAVLLLAGNARAACPQGSVQVAASCGAVTTAGCCDVYQYALFCSEGLLCTRDCGALLQTCGWQGIKTELAGNTAD
mgnify:CR=1 FL=1